MKKFILFTFFSLFMTAAYAQIVYVGNVHPDTSEKEMIKLFSEFGVVKSAVLSSTKPDGFEDPMIGRTDRTGNKISKTNKQLYATVEMADSTAVTTAVRTLQKRKFKGRTLTFETPVFSNR